MTPRIVRMDGVNTPENAPNLRAFFTIVTNLNNFQFAHHLRVTPVFTLLTPWLFIFKHGVPQSKKQSIRSFVVADCPPCDSGFYSFDSVVK